MNILSGFKARGMLTLKSAGMRVSLDVYEIKSRMCANVRDPEHIVFDVSVVSIVTVRETTGALDLMKPSVINKIQADEASEIESMIDDVVGAVQHDIGKDALGLGVYLKENHNKTWKKVSNDWDRGKRWMTGCVVKVHASVTIRQTGTVDQSERA